MATTPRPLDPDITGTGAHPHASDDTPAARGLLGIVLALLVVCSVIAAVIYAVYHENPKDPVPTEQTAPVPTP